MPLLEDLKQKQKQEQEQKQEQPEGGSSPLTAPHSGDHLDSQSVKNPEYAAVLQCLEAGAETAEDVVRMSDGEIDAVTASFYLPD